MKRNKTILRLPFKGSWYVVWGGGTKKLNRHQKGKKQSSAFDFLITDDKEKDYKGKGKNNKDYYAFGKKILAPADGVVVDIVDGIKDNKPGLINRNFHAGNVIIIKHRKDEISLFAHLKQGSVKVKAGDKVKIGQVIGLCGNSGKSSQPHLHYQMHDNEIIQDRKGVKCYFQNIKVKGKTDKKEYSPIREDIISN